MVARTKFRAVLRQLVGDRYDQVQPVIAHLLNIELEPEQLHVRSLDPRALQSQLVFAMRALFEALSARKPLILAFEDFHWADAASIELLTILMELTDFNPLMILVVCRPGAEGGSWEFRFHAQRNYPHRLTEIQLNPLTPDQAQLLIRNLLHISELPDRLQSLVLERSEGNPLFLEEIVRTLIEGQVLCHEGDRWTFVGEVEQSVIPSLLQGVISARIDHLPAAAKIVLQHASVIGRVFTYRVLQMITDSDVDLDRSLAHLLRVDFIREQARLPEAEYLFKHVITQEAAYASILYEQRQSFHRKVVVYLEQTGVDTSDEQAAILAHHCLRAEDWEKALEYTLQAAGRASKLYAQPEAIAHYWQALELMERITRTAERRRTHMEVVLSLGKLPGSFRDANEEKEGLRHIDEAIRSAVDSGEVGILAQLEAVKGYSLWDESILKQAVTHSESSGDVFARAFTVEMYAHYLGSKGKYVKALTYFGQLIDMMSIEGANYEQAMNMASGGRCYCARAGKLEEALRYAAEAREIGEAMGDARLLAWCATESEPYMYKGLWEQVIRVAEEGQPVARKIGEWSVILWISAWLGIAYLKVGRLEDARRVIDRAQKESQSSTLSRVAITYLQIAAAQLHLATGEPEKALGAARKALKLAESSLLRLEQGAANRVIGQIHGATGSREEAEAAFRLGLQILGEIQSRPELAQTLLEYGRFKIDNDSAGGRALIERALSMFEEIGATGWINEARAVLS